MKDFYMRAYVISPEEMCYNYNIGHILKYDIIKNIAVINSSITVYECDYRAFEEYCLKYKIDLALRCI